MRQIYAIVLLVLFVISSDGQNATKTIGIYPPYDPYADIISSGLKDKAGNIWFAVSSRGVYRYDGKGFTNYTNKDGLCNNLSVGLCFSYKRCSIQLNI